MNWGLIALFSGITLINVIGQTVKSIVTIKCGKWMAAIVNAVAYGVYTIAIVAAANFLGVLIVKIIEEKARKDKLWKVEATVRQASTEALSSTLREKGISYSTTEVYGKDEKRYTLFNIFCHTSTETDTAIAALKDVNAKFFVSGSVI